MLTFWNQALSQDRSQKNGNGLLFSDDCGGQKTPYHLHHITAHSVNFQNLVSSKSWQKVSTKIFHKKSLHKKRSALALFRQQFSFSPNQVKTPFGHVFFRF